MNRSYSDADKKYLYGRSGGRCAIPDCRIEITLPFQQGEKVKQIGNMAHIVAHSPDGPRGCSTYPQDQLDSYHNLILLCPTCHNKIDAQPENYSADYLRETKTNHETWVATQLNESMLQVRFAELEVAVNAIASHQHYASNGFDVITPEEKIQKNALTAPIRGLILTGLSRSYEVENYLIKSAQGDANLPERLKNGFKEKYMELKKTLSGDKLFMEMFEFSKSGHKEFKQQAASLAILVHLFHLCEVFET